MASQQMVLVGGNNVTLSQSLDALSLSATITINGGNSFSAGISSGGNTSGNTGLVSQQLVLAGGNSVTLSGSTNAGSMTVTISGPSAVSSAFSAGVSNIGNTSGNTGTVSNQLVLVGGDNVTLSGSTNAGSETITISAAAAGAPILSLWNNEVAAEAFFKPFTHNYFQLAQLDPKNDVFPGNITVSTLYFEISQSSNITGANSGTLNIGFYTRNASTLSLLNSGQSTWEFSANTNNSQAYSGRRFITFHSSLWSTSPTFSVTDYYMGWLIQTSGVDPGISIIGFRYLAVGQRSGTFGNSITSGNTSMGAVPFIGEGTATTSVLPTTVGLGDLAKTGSVASFVPHVVFNNISSDF